MLAMLRQIGCVLSQAVRTRAHGNVTTWSASVAAGFDLVLLCPARGCGRHCAPAGSGMMIDYGVVTPFISGRECWLGTNGHREARWGEEASVFSVQNKGLYW